MKTFFALLCLLTSSARADLSTHEVFKHFIGSWKAASELKDENNKIVTIKEEWTGKAEGDNGFVIESKVTFTGDVGQTTLEGVVKHQKVKLP